MVSVGPGAQTVDMTRSSICPVLIIAACACGGGTQTAPTPPPATVATIGPSGGSVVSLDGLARLDVPAGALGAEVPLALRLATNVPLDAAAVKPAAYEITPANVTFQSAARLQVTFTPSLRPSGTAEEELRIHRLAGGQWQPGGGAQDLDATVHRAGTTVTTSGTYGVRWPDPTVPCTLPEDRQFDFWIGEWTFQQTVPVTSSGINSITRDATGCLIIERFNNGAGHSVSLFSRLDSQWHQTYVDSQNNRVVLIGTFDGSRMVLHQAPRARWLWERVNATLIRYWGEQSADGVTWTVGFDSTYAAR